MRTIREVWFIGAGLFVSLNFLHAAVLLSAQPVETSGSDDLSAAVEAAEQTTPTPADEVPAIGEFHSAAHPDWPPLPGNFGYPAWNLGGNVWLLDDLTTDSTSISTAKSMTLMSDADLNPGDGGTNSDGGDYTNSFVPFVIDTNLLWLELTNYDGNLAYLNIHNATNFCYAIWGTTALPGGWNVETELFPTDGTDQTNCLPFTVATLGRTNLFLRAMDWTGIDSDGDGVPDWWAWEYWATNNLPDTNLDYSGSGNTFAQDYSNNVAPVVFSFTGLEATNNYVNSMSAPVQLDVAGNPYYVAVLVDDNDFSNAVWNTYSGSTVSVNLGITEGWHDVWIGLRGHADDPSVAVWQWKRLKLDYTPPALVITGPTNGTVDVPMMQLTGYSPEALGRISYDLSNAAGTVTNQQVLVLNQYYDTNTWEFTTNTFQGFDILLTNGVNTLTLHATDLAGNVATLVTNFTLDYSAKTNPPNVQIVWPQNGAQISGNSFTVQGQVDDPTVTVIATITDTNGDVTSSTGEVERNGRFWLENLPLNGGTNAVSITVSDAAGNLTTNNFNVVQSALVLTMNPVSDPAQLWQPTVSVSGTVSDPTAVVTINGVQGTNNGDGTWSADGVPASAGGVAVFQMQAQTPGQPPVMAASDSDKPWRLYAASDIQKLEGTNDYREVVTGTYNYVYEEQSWQHFNFDWLDGWGVGGSADNNWQNDFWSWDDSHWTDTGGQTKSMSGDWTGMGEEVDINLSGTNTTASTNYFDLTYYYIGSEHCNVNDPVDTTVHRGVIDGAGDVETDINHETYTRMAQTVWHLETGGKAVPARQSLWQFWGGAVVEDKRAVPPPGTFAGLGGYVGGIPNAQIAIGSLGTMGTDGYLWAVLPDAQDVDVTSYVAGQDFYSFHTRPQKFPVYIGLTTSTTNANLATDVPEVCVGQNVMFTLNGLPMGSISNLVGNWQLPAKYVNQQTNYSATCTTYVRNDNLLANTNQTSCWFVNGSGGPVGVGLNLLFNNGQYVNIAAMGSFTVFRPSVTMNHIDEPRYYTISDDIGLTCKLKLGTNDESGKGTMIYKIEVDSKPADDHPFDNQFYGIVGITQLITAGYSDPLYMFSDERCDGSEFYSPPSRVIHSCFPVLDDGPSEIWTTPNIVNLSCRDFVRFKPDGDGSIWVTLGIVTWDTVGTAEQDFWGNWTTTTDVTPDPSDPDNSDTFPVWTINQGGLH